jgi:beta-glucosidase
LAEKVKVERVAAEEVRAEGIQWAFAPCVTAPRDIRWGRTYQGYPEDPEVVKELAGPVVRGFHGPDRIALAVGFEPTAAKRAAR